MSIEPQSPMPSGNPSPSNLSNGNHPSGKLSSGQSPQQGEHVSAATLRWDLLSKRMQSEFDETGLGEWIDADLEMMEVELADFSTPGTLAVRRG